MRVNSTRTRTRWLNLAIGFGTTAGFVWLLTRGLNWGALGQAFAGLSVSMALLALVFLAIGYMVRIVRWWWMLRALEPCLPLGACVGPFLSSIAVNNVLPFRAGDILRVLGFRRQLRSPAVRVLVTVVVERVLDLAVLVGVFFLGLLSLPEGAFPRNFTVAVIWITGTSLIVIAALPLFALWYGHIGDRLPRHRFLSARRWPESVSRHGAHLVEALNFMRSLPRMLSLITLSIVAWTCEGAVFATVAVAIHTNTAAFGPWFAMATGTLATLLPSTPGYVGTFDYFAAEGLAAYGSTSELAVAFALVVHAVLWVPLTAIGLLFMFHQGVELRGITHD